MAQQVVSLGVSHTLPVTPSGPEIQAVPIVTPKRGGCLSWGRARACGHSGSVGETPPPFIPPPRPWK